MKVEYIHAKSVAEAEKLLVSPQNEFIEGIMYDKSNTIIMYGNFVNQPSSPSKVIYNVVYFIVEVLSTEILTF